LMKSNPHRRKLVGVFSFEMPDRILLHLTDFSAHPLPIDAGAAQNAIATIRKYPPHPRRQ